MLCCIGKCFASFVYLHLAVFHVFCSRVFGDFRTRSRYVFAFVCVFGTICKSNVSECGISRLAFFQCLLAIRKLTSETATGTVPTRDQPSPIRWFMGISLRIFRAAYKHAVAFMCMFILIGSTLSSSKNKPGGRATPPRWRGAWPPSPTGTPQELAAPGSGPRGPVSPIARRSDGAPATKYQSKNNNQQTFTLFHIRY